MRVPFVARGRHRLALGVVRAGCLALGIAACRGVEAPAPGLTIASVPGWSARVSPGAASPRVGSTDTQEPDGWWSTARGREAIAAYRRQDDGVMVPALEAVLVDGEASAGEVGATLWHLALHDRRQRRFTQAAERFRKIRDVPDFEPLFAHLRVLEAEARLDAGDSPTALALVAELDISRVPALRESAGFVRADAFARTGRGADAEREYRNLLEALGGKHRRRHEARIKLARVLAERSGAEAKREAVRWYETVLLEAPYSDYGDEAEARLAGLRRQAGVRRRASDEVAFENAVSVARVEAKLRQRRYKEAVAEAARTLRRTLTPAQRCAVWFAKGTAEFKDRRRAESMVAFDKAAAACRQAKVPDTWVKARYQAARGLYAKGRYPAAASAFEAIAKEHADHSYADDALVLAGESWESASEVLRAKAVYQRALVGWPEGDMTGDARRRLWLLAFQAGDYEGALETARSGAVGADPGKPEYLAGRALGALGRLDESRTAYLEAITRDRLGYSSLMALSRLRELGDEAFEEGLRRLVEPSPARLPELGAPSRPGVHRALLLARLGLGGMAKAELEAEGVTGWPAVLILDRSGLHAEVQAMIADLGTAWRSVAPADSARELWRLAHPRPYGELVQGRARAAGLDELLPFAVMQTESRFDPSAISVVGARGLLQLMPETAKRVAETLPRGPRSSVDLHDPAYNVELGATYLGQLARSFGTDDDAIVLAIPSYNAGAGAVRKWLRERGALDADLFVESIPYDETRAYTQRVLGRWFAYRVLYGEGDLAKDVPTLSLRLPREGS